MEIGVYNKVNLLLLRFEIEYFKKEDTIEKTIDKLIKLIDEQVVAMDLENTEYYIFLPKETTKELFNENKRVYYKTTIEDRKYVLYSFYYALIEEVSPDCYPI